MDLVKWLTLLPWRQVHPYLCLASVNVEKSKKIVITNSDLYVTVIRLRYGRKEEEISPKIAPIVYVLLYIRSLPSPGNVCMPRQARDNPRNSCLFVKVIWAQNTVQKSCGLLASVIVASFEPGFMFVRLDPVQTPNKEAAPGLSSLRMGGFKVSLLQRALPLTDLWFYSQHPTSEIFPCLPQDCFNLFYLCVGKKGITTWYN